MNEQAKQYQRLSAKCWADDAFKQRLLADPAGTLAAEGMAVPEGVTIRVVEDTAREVTLFPGGADPPPAKVMSAAK